VADPLVRAAKEAFKLELTGGMAIAEALFIHPFTDLKSEIAAGIGNWDAEDWGRALGDVAGVLGIVALLPIPGVDVIAGVAAITLAGAAAAADWVAAAHHEQGASYMQAGLATAGFALAGVGLVARGAVDADSALFTKAVDDNDLGALMDLKNGESAAASGKSLWLDGLNSKIPSIKDLTDGYQLAKAPLNPSEAKSGLAGLGQAVSNTARSEVAEKLSGGLDEFSHSPAGVQIAHAGWAADGVNVGVGTVQDVETQPTGSQVP